MGTGYIRNDVSNNIADGNVINASDLDGEFDAIEAAFNNTTGHTHDGTSAEGAPITVVGPAQEWVVDGTALYPKTDNTYDVGKAGAEIKDIYVDGTANIDSLVADTADINGGTLDGAVIGGSTPAAITGTTITANSGFVGDVTGNADTATALATSRNFSITGDVTASAVGFDGTGNVVFTAAIDPDLVTIGGLDKTDGNFIVANGSAWTVESGSTARTSLGLGTIATQSDSSVDINGGTIDGTTIGGSSPSSAQFTSIGVSGEIGISNTRPILRFTETDGTSTYGQTGIGQTGDVFVIDTRDSGGNLVANDYLIRKGASGATEHSFRVADTERLSISAGGIVSTVGMEVTSTAPIIRFTETDGTSTHRQTGLYQSGNAFLIDTRDSSGAFVASDYVITKSSTGASEHSFRIQGTERLEVTASGITVAGAANISGALTLESFANTEDVLPKTANLYDLGATNVGLTIRRYRDCYLINSPNVSSDARLKDNIADLTDAERRAAAKIKTRTFTMKESGKKKVGYIAQEIIEAMASEGLDAFEYGLVSDGETYGVDYDAVNAFRLG